MALSANQTRVPGGSLASLLDRVQYREYKILLKPERFHKSHSFHKFWKVAHRTARELGVKLSEPDDSDRMQVREVLFYDTPHFRLYNNGFILRTRTPIKHGLPEPHYEMVLKFRHPDRAAAAAVDMRPLLPCIHTIKFKEEILLSLQKLGGRRSVFSHNCELDSPNLLLTQRFEIISHVFPAIGSLGANPKAVMAVVNGVVIDEDVLHLGELDFGGKMTAKATVAIWRNRATRQLLIGEFAFQLKFDSPDDVPKKPRELSEAFYEEFQLRAEDWVRMGTTKTAFIYGLGKAPVKNHE